MAPLCICNCGQPVKPAKPCQAVGQRGPRMVDGQRWRWFASRACSGRVTGRLSQPHAMQAAAEAWREKTRQRRAQRLVEACRPFIGPDGKIRPVDMAKTLARLERTAYARGLDAGTKRWQRTA